MSAPAKKKQPPADCPTPDEAMQDAFADEAFVDEALAEAEAQDHAGEQVEAHVEIPAGFTCREKGVFLIKTSIGKDGEQKQTFVPVTLSPCWCEAMSRDGNHENWGRLVIWRDPDGQRHEEALPASMFHGTGGELVQHLADRGLLIVSGMERKLVEYLSKFIPSARLRSATRTGWQSGDLIFVLPNEIVGRSANERIVFQPESRVLNTDCFGQAGDFEIWKQALAQLNSPAVRFFTSAALAAPLLKLTGTPSGGFHGYGQTSRGKTTLAQIAASIWGNGSDPSVACGSSYIQQWLATRNGLEAMASGFNDLPLIVDEIGQASALEFGPAIYSLLNGTGKQRSTRTGAAARRRGWRIMVLSFGEIAVRDFLPDARGGQLVRLVDVELRDLFPGREETDAVKLIMSENYGHAGPTFLRSGNLLEGWPAWADNEDQIGPAPTAEAGRVRRRFSLVAFAGEMAIRRGILPWPAGSIIEATRELYRNWLTGGASDEAARGIDNVRQYILRNRARFDSGHEDDRLPFDRAGIFKDGCYHFFPSAWRDACGSVAGKVVQQALKQAGLLHHESGKLSNRIRVDGGDRVRVVSVRERILDSEDEVAPGVPDRPQQEGTEEIVENTTDSPAVPGVPAKNDDDEDEVVEVRA